MSRRASNNVCLFCQLRRPRSSIKSRPVAARSLISSQATAAKDATPPQSDSVIAPFTLSDLQRQLHLFSPSDVFRRRMLSIESRWRRGSLVQSIEHQLNASPRQQYELDALSSQDGLPKQNNARAAENPVISLIRLQLQSATSIEDVLRILTCHLQSIPDERSIKKAHILATNAELIKTIKAQLSRFSLGRQLTILGLLSSRLQAYGQSLPLPLLLHALNVSAADHSLPVFCQFFKTWLNSTDSYNPIQPADLTNILISLNLGLLRTLRGTRPERTPAMLQLLYTSAFLSPNTYSLEQALRPDDIGSLGPWLANLVACRANSHIWQEWQLAESGQRWICNHTDPKQQIDMQLQRAGLFIIAFCRLGCLDEAWKVFKASSDALAAAQQQPHPATHDLDVYGIHRSVWNALLTNWSSKPTLTQPLQDALNQSLLNRFAHLCVQVETELGVIWHKPTDTAPGYHHISGVAADDDDAAKDNRDQSAASRRRRRSSITPTNLVLKLLDSELNLFIAADESVSPTNEQNARKAASPARKGPDALELAVVKPWGFNSLTELFKGFRTTESNVAHSR